MAMLYMSNDSDSNCLNLRIVMKDKVDSNLLQQAVNFTMERYSYLNVRIIEKIKPYYVLNEEPYKVIETRTVKELGGPDTGYHLIWFTYYDSTIKISFSHILVDGKGILTIARTLIYYYSKLRYDSNLSSKGILTLDTPVNPNEMVDIYSNQELISKKAKQANETLLKKKKKETGKVFTFKDSDKISFNNSSTKRFYIKVSVNQMMKVCKTYEISPSVLISLFVADSISRIHPSANSITCGLAMSIRDAVECKETLRNAVTPTTITYNSKIKDMSFENKCTSIRGQVILATDETVQCAALEKLMDALKIVRKLPYIRLTKSIFASVLGSIMSESFQVSYAGQADIGEAEKYVEHILFDFEMPAKSVNVEMTSVGDNMMICYGQNWDEEIYLNSLLDELHEQGIDTEIVEISNESTPKLYSSLNKKPLHNK